MRVVKGALRAAKLKPADLVAIGISNQRETTVLWDRRSGRPVHRAIVWQDRRTAGVCDRLKADGLEDTVRRKTGLVIDPYFAGTKLRWLFDSIRGLRTRPEQLAFGTIDSWLVWKLTDGHAHLTDYTNASRTLLYDVHRRCWDEEGSTWSAERPGRGCPASCGVEWNGRDDRRHGVWRRGAHRWHRRRSAGGAFRSGLLPPWNGEEHVRNWLFCTHVHRQAGHSLAKGVTDNRRLRRGRQTGLRVGRVDFRCRGGGTVVARWAGTAQVGEGKRALRSPG